MVAQIGALTLLLPFVVREDYGVFSLRDFPDLAGQVLILSTSITATLHATRSLQRPKYVADNAPSSYFVERFRVSDRELDVVSGVQAGLSNNEIAEKLSISPQAVEKHLYNIYQKAGVRNRVQLFNLLRSDAL